MLDRFTIKAAQALQEAQMRAGAMNHSEVAPLHLLAALVSSNGSDGASGNGGIVVPILEKAGAEVSRIRSILESELGRLSKVSGGSLTPARSLQETLQTAQEQADAMKDRYVSTEHLLLALADVKSNAKEILTVSGANKEAILAALKEIRGSATVTSQNAEATYQALERYGRDLVAVAREGKLGRKTGEGYYSWQGDKKS